MQAVDYIGSDIDSSMEPESYLCAVNVVVNCFRQTDNVQTLIGEQICGLVSTVSAQSQQTVKLLFFIGILHGFYLVHVVLADNGHHLERLPFCTQNGTALSEYARKIRGLHFLGDIVYQTVVSVLDTHYLHIVLAHALEAGFSHASDSSVQTGTVASACKDTDSSFCHNKTPPSYCKRLLKRF